MVLSHFVRQHGDVVLPGRGDHECQRGLQHIGPKVFIGASDYRIYCIEGSTGQTLWRYQSGGYIYSSPAVGDINADGKAEVIFTSEDGRLYALDAHSGTLLWRFTTRTALFSSPVLADLTGMRYLR